MNEIWHPYNGSETLESFRNYLVWGYYSDDTELRNEIILTKTNKYGEFYCEKYLFNVLMYANLDDVGPDDDQREMYGKYKERIELAKAQREKDRHELGIRGELI